MAYADNNEEMVNTFGNTAHLVEQWSSTFALAGTRRTQAVPGQFAGILQIDGYGAYDHVGGAWRSQDRLRSLLGARLARFSHFMIPKKPWLQSSLCA
jgi:hypothetical protein